MFSQSDFNSWMNAKYAALGEHAAADTTRSGGEASANYARANTGIPAEAQHARAIASLMVPAQANLYNAEAGKTNVGTAAALRQLDNAPEAADSLVGGLIGVSPLGSPSSGSSMPAPSTSASSPLLNFRPLGIGQAFQQQQPRQPERYAKGTDKVPGKGDGTKDTVAAELAPGEAVLNRGAAEHLGRDNIKSLNALGMLHMGMIDPKGAKGKDTKDDRAKGSDTKAAPKDAKDDRAKPAQAKPAAKNPKDNRAHYVGGHSNVGKGKKSDTPKVDPQMLQQVMSMMGGGGMPQQAQQPQPLPGGMP